MTLSHYKVHSDRTEKIIAKIFSFYSSYIQLLLIIDDILKDDLQKKLRS